jgi:hypothetical protein
MARTRAKLPPAPVGENRFVPDPHHDAATRWCAFARGVLERLLDDARRLRGAALTPGHPLHHRFSETDLRNAIEMLGDASTALMNCDSVPPCLIDVPDPLLDD